MKTKIDQIKEAVKSENWGIAFKIAKSFFTGLTKDQKRSIDIAHECNMGNTGFYKSIGVDTEMEVYKAKSILKMKFA